MRQVTEFKLAEREGLYYRRYSQVTVKPTILR